MRRIHTYRHGPECPLCLAEANATSSSMNDWRRADSPRATALITAGLLLGGLVFIACLRLGVL